MYDTLKNQFQMALNRIGYTAKVNNDKEIKVILKQYKDRTKAVEHTYLLAEIGEIQQGDIVEINNVKYLVIHEETNLNNVYNTFLMRRIRHTAKFVVNGELYTFDCAIDEGMQTISNDVIDIMTGKIIVLLQENIDTEKLDVNMRFIKFRQAWKIISITNAEKGIFKLYCEKDIINETRDDMKNEIADKDKLTPTEPEHTYSVEISNPVLKLNTGNTYQLNVVAKDNDVVVDNPTIIYSSDNEAIATVDANGLITAVSAGSVVFTVSFEDAQTTMSIVIDDPIEEDNFTYEIQGADEIMWNFTETYVVKKFNNGIETDGVFTFELTGDYADIVGTTDNTVDIKAKNSVYGYVTLTATDVDNGEIVTKEILIKGLI